MELQKRASMAIKKSPQRASSSVRKPNRKRPVKKAARPVDPGAQRLNKILAAAGLGSRRVVEELIVQGRVQVERDIVTDLSFKIDPRTVTIKVDGTVLKRERLVYHALNKPTGVLSTNRDPDGRTRVIDLVPGKERVFSVGRLDRSSEGLILLTNDGDLAQRLAHPKFAIQKSYFVVVSGIMEQEELDKLRKGVHLAEGFARIDGATIRRKRKGCTELEIVLSEGKNREIRRILARAGHKVVVLRRLSIGPLRLGQLPVGASRPLTPSEVKALYAITQQKPVAKKAIKQPVGSKQNPTALDDDDFSMTPFQVDEDDDFGSDMDDEGFGSMGIELSEDDFVGHFSSTKAGAVLGYEGEAEAKPMRKRPSKKSSPARGESESSDTRSDRKRSGAGHKASAPGKRAGSGRGGAQSSFKPKAAQSSLKRVGKKSSRGPTGRSSNSGGSRGGSPGSGKRGGRGSKGR
jgi:23S rRNA pseudouridine2605 synthase